MNICTVLKHGTGTRTALKQSTDIEPGTEARYWRRPGSEARTRLSNGLRLLSEHRYYRYRLYQQRGRRL
eukprot:3551194-Rhodomonas_salina.1